MRFTSSYVIWAMASPPELICSIRLRRFLRGMRNAGKFDALDARNGYALLEKLRLNAPPQLPSYFVLPGGRGPDLQANLGGSAIEVLSMGLSGARETSTKVCDQS